MTRATTAPAQVAGPPPSLRDDLLAVLADAPDGRSDAEVRAALADAHPGLKTQKVNLLCRRLCAAGEVERVGTRPIRNRLRPARRAPAVEPSAAAPVTLTDRPCPEDTVPVRRRGRGPADPRDPAPPAAPAPAVSPALPAHDPDLAWSRGVNVAATVAAWLVRRGATVRAATTTPGAPAPHAHDLVVRLDGQDVHVEVTGWPPESPRRRSTDAAADWFVAATTAASVRARAHAGARVVIALPETRRYRTLAARARPCDAGTGAGPVVAPEVWFVDARGAVRPLSRFTPVLPG